MDDIVRNSTASSEISIMSDPYACIYGNVYIYDFSTVTSAHLMLLTPTLIKQIVVFFEKTLPLRIKMVCFINMAPYAMKIIRMFLQYVPEKLRQRVRGNVKLNLDKTAYDETATVDNLSM